MDHANKGRFVTLLLNAWVEVMRITLTGERAENLVRLAQDSVAEKADRFLLLSSINKISSGILSEGFLDSANGWAADQDDDSYNNGQGRFHAGHDLQIVSPGEVGTNGTDGGRSGGSGIDSSDARILQEIVRSTCARICRADGSNR